jgi:hypothetical protein
MDSRTRSITQALSVYRLSVRPQVEAPELVHPRFIGNLDDPRVVISADGLEDVDWDVASPPQAWILILPELIYCSGEKWGYQVGMEWTGEGDSWSYRDYPVRDLLDGWRIVDGVHRLDPGFAERAPVHGRLSGSIASSEIGVRYTLELTNSSPKPWTDVFWWLCLNHYQSRVTGNRPHFRVGSSWTPAQEMSGGQVHTYFPAPGMADEYRTSPNQGFHAPETELSYPGVVSWNRTLQGPLLVAHLSTDAVAVGSNQAWPCTDLQLWFGDMSPGETKSATAHVMVARCDLATFAAQADQLTEALRREG